MILTSIPPGPAGVVLLTLMSHLAEFLLARLQAIPTGEVGKRADLAGVSREQMTRWRRGKLPVNPTLSTLERLAAVLDLRIGFTEAASGEIVAEGGAEYAGSDETPRSELEVEQERLKSRVRRLEHKLGVRPDESP